MKFYTSKSFVTTLIISSRDKCVGSKEEFWKSWFWNLSMTSPSTSSHSYTSVFLFIRVIFCNLNVNLSGSRALSHPYESIEDLKVFSIRLKSRSIASIFYYHRFFAHVSVKIKLCNFWSTEIGLSVEGKTLLLIDIECKALSLFAVKHSLRLFIS